MFLAQKTNNWKKNISIKNAQSLEESQKIHILSVNLVRTQEKAGEKNMENMSAIYKLNDPNKALYKLRIFSPSRLS